MREGLFWGAFKFFDLATGKLAIDFVDQPETVTTNSCTGLDFSSNGLYLVTVGYSASVAGGIVVYSTLDWSVVVDQSLVDLSHPFYVESDTTPFSTKFSPNNAYLAVAFTGSPYFRMLDVNNSWAKITVPTLTGPVASEPSIAFSQDSSLFAITNKGTDVLTIYTTADWQKVIGTPVVLKINYTPSIAFSHDNAWLCVVTDTEPVITIYSTIDWSVVETPPIFYGRGTCCAFSPDNQYLVFGSTYGLFVYSTVSWWPVPLEFPDDEFMPTNTTIDSVKFNQDGTKLVTTFNSLNRNGQSYRRVLIYDATTWTILIQSEFPTTVSNAKILDWPYSDILYSISGNVSGYGLNEVKLFSISNEVSTNHPYGTIDGTELTDASGNYLFLYTSPRERAIVAVNLVEDKIPLIKSNITAI